MKTTVLLLLLLSVSAAAWGQVPEELDSRLRGKRKLADIMREVDVYYKKQRQLPTRPPATGTPIAGLAPVEKEEMEDSDCESCKEGFDGAYTHWKRWEYFHRSRLSDDGEVQNISARNLAELQATTRKTTSRTAAIFSGSWSFKGPNNQVDGNNVSTGVGRVNALAFHPTDPKTIWAATSSGGLFKTTNTGTNWISISDAVSSLGVADVAVNYNNPNELYMLTGDGDSYNGSYWFVQAYGFLRFSAGVLKTTDGGTTWQKTGLSFNATDFEAGFRLAIHPTNPSILLAATTAGLYRTENAGASWTLVKNSSTTGGFYDVKFKPDNGNVAYATERGNNASMLISTDGGSTWSSSGVTGLPTGVYRATIGLTPGKPDSLFLVCGKSIDPSHYKGLFAGKYNSVTKAVAFTMIHNTPNLISAAYNGIDYANGQDAAEYDLSLAVSPVSTGNMVVGATFARYTKNGGGTFFNGGQPHADIHQLAYNPLDNVLYAATDGGVYKSTDNGFTYTSISQGLSATQVYHMADFDGDNNVYMIGTQDNGTNVKKSSGFEIRNIYGCDGFATAIHPTNSNILLGVCNQEVWLSKNGGTSFVDKFNPPAHNTWYSLVGFNPLNPSIMYVGGQDTVYRTNNDGLTWSAQPYRGNSAFHLCPSSNRIYAAGANILGALGNATLTRIDNDFGTFTDLTTKPGMPSFAGSSTYITSIASLPGNTGDVWIGISGYRNGIKVYHSTNGGLSWTNESKSLPNVPVNALAVDALGNVYVGNDFGIFARRPGDTDWIPFYNGLPNVPVTELAVNDGAGRIKAATFGRGVWESDLLASSCPVSLVVFSSYDGQYNFQASDNIQSNATVLATDGAKVTMNAGNYISLTPGFSAGAGSFFKAQIAPCGPVNTNSVKKSNSNLSEIPPAPITTRQPKEATLPPAEPSKAATKQLRLIKRKKE